MARSQSARWPRSWKSASPALRENDWAAVRRIYAEGIAIGEATAEADVPAARELKSRWLTEHRWIAEVDGVAVGWAAAARVSERPHYSGVAEISIYVGAGHRARGVGKALLRKQLIAADHSGLWTLQTSTYAENRAAIALHHSGGFRVVGVRERVVRHQGVWRDIVVFERRSAFSG